jgi:hypothetical protein
LVSAKAGELKESRNGGKTRGREEKKNGRWKKVTWLYCKMIRMRSPSLFLVPNAWRQSIGYCSLRGDFHRGRRSLSGQWRNCRTDRYYIE